MAYVESENDRVLNAALEFACPDQLAIMANEYLGRLCNRWNAGFRPGGPKNAKWKRSLSGKEESVKRRTLHHQGTGRYQKAPIPNTRTSDSPLLECHNEADRVIRHHDGTIVYIPSSTPSGMYFGESISAMETLFWEFVADGTLRSEQAEFGIVHGYRRVVRRAFSRVCKRAERARLLRVTSLDTKVSTDVDGMPITYGSLLDDDSCAHENETMLGRATSDDNEMLLAEKVVHDAECLVVERLARRKHGKMLTAIAAWMAEGLNAQRIFGRIRENGTRIGKRSVERMLADIRQEYAVAISEMETDLRTDTEYEPISERITHDVQRRMAFPLPIDREHEHNQVIPPNRWTYTEHVQPNERDVTGLIQFGNSLKYKSEVDSEYKCAVESWEVSDDAIERQNDRARRLDALCALHGID